MKASDIIHDVSVDLNDNYSGAEYTRWTESQLAAYYQEALIEGASSYPQLFYKTVVVPVESSHGWQTACDCTHIKRVVGECTQYGDLLSRVSQRKDSNSFIWPGSIADSCDAKSTEHTAFWGYSINSTRDSQFQVYPAPLPTERRYVLLECYQEPDPTDLLLDVPSRLVALIKQWMLYRALIVDSENNPTIVEVAKTHLQTFTALLTRLDAQSKKEEEEQDERDSNLRAVQNGSSNQVSS